MISWDRVAQLHNDVGVDCFDEIVEAFIMEMDEILDALARTHDAAGQQARFHALKGSALNLGFTDFAHQCSALESVTRSEPVSSDQIDQVIAAYHSAKTNFEKGLSKITTGHG